MRPSVRSCWCCARKTRAACSCKTSSASFFACNSRVGATNEGGARRDADEDRQAHRHAREILRHARRAGGGRVPCWLSQAEEVAVNAAGANTPRPPTTRPLCSAPATTLSCHPPVRIKTKNNLASTHALPLQQRRGTRKVRHARRAPRDGSFVARRRRRRGRVPSLRDGDQEPRDDA